MLDGDTKTMTYTEGAPTALRIAPNPSTMRAGGKQTFQVSPVNRYGIVVDATEDMEVSLLSSDASGYFLASEAPNAAIIQTLHIRKGSSGAEVAYTQTASGATKLSVQHDEMSGAAQLTVLAQSVYEVRFTNQEYKGENALQIGQPGVITARLYDRFGNATTTDAALTLYASSKSGEGTLTNNGHIVIAAGNSQGAVSFTPDRPGSYDIVVFDSVTGESNGGLRAIEQSVEAVYGAVTNFKFDQRVIEIGRASCRERVF